jgi:hypothetical protein
MSDRLGDRVQCPRQSWHRQLADEQGLAREAAAEDKKT